MYVGVSEDAHCQSGRAAINRRRRLFRIDLPFFVVFTTLCRVHGRPSNLRQYLSLLFHTDNNLAAA